MKLMLSGLSNENLCEIQHFNCDVYNLIINFEFNLDFVLEMIKWRLSIVMYTCKYLYVRHDKMRKKKK